MDIKIQTHTEDDTENRLPSRAERNWYFEPIPEDGVTVRNNPVGSSQQSVLAVATPEN